MLALSECQFLLSLTTGVEIRKGRLMKLLYTDMSQDLTEILTEQATSYAQKGKRVFYIAPNALSFEKERKVLEYLPQSASFEITVTRFTQMARYFILNTSNPKTQLDDTGLAMIFYKVLSHMGDDELKVYGLYITERVHLSVYVYDVLIVKAAHHMDDGVGHPDVGEELVAKALAL